MMTIYYIFHSCFVMEAEEVLVVFDYWLDTPDKKLHRLIAETQKQVYFVVSHFHEDHYNPEILHWVTRKGKARVIVSADTARRQRIAPEQLTATLRAPHTSHDTAANNYDDEYLKITAFPSTDVGMSTVVELPDGQTAYHAGDNNNWYFTEGNEKLKVTAKDMEGRYLATLRSVKATYPKIDHAMIPVDPRLGEHTLRGPRQWLDTIRTGHFYPMHFWQRTPEVMEEIERLRSDYRKTTFVYQGER